MELTLEQKLQPILSASQHLSLFVLQLPIEELDSYLMRQSDENPMLDVHHTHHDLTSLSAPSPSQQDQEFWRTPSFARHIINQLGQDRLLPPEFLPYCIFIAESLDKWGYFTEDLEETAQILGTTVEKTEQALLLVQERSPTGVGARNLQECLLLQLIKTPHFNEKTLKLISQDFARYETLDFKWMAELLETTQEEAQQHWQIIRNLRPIPTQGYDNGDRIAYLRPEAIVEQQGHLFLPTFSKTGASVSINPHYAQLFAQSDAPEVVSFLKQYHSTAQQIIFAVDRRKSTLQQIITAVVAHQQEYFRQGAQGLAPLGVAKIAEELGLHSSTVSRAIRDKYLSTPQGLVSLKSLFSQKITPTKPGEQEVSRVAVLNRLRQMIQGEDKKKPFSDATLQGMLQECSMNISRRTVAKYRDELGILGSSQRKQSAS